MSDSYPLAPVWFVDVVGSSLVIVFAFLAVTYAARLARIQKSRLIWTYMLWLCAALALFGLSRGVGHIAKRYLLMMDMRDIWVSLRPYSGGINTIAFVLVASITLFFQRVQKINREILQDKKALETASREVMHLNRNLESVVQERTEELSRSEQKFRRIFESSMDVIFILDDKGRFLDINPAGITTLGYDRDRLVGQMGLYDLCTSGESYASLFQELHTTGFVKDRECLFLASNGSELHLLLSATIRRGESGETLNYEGIAKDITSRVQMERQLQQADKLASLGQISTGIAHEINNPLGIILGYTQLLLREQAPRSQMHDDLKTIEKHTRNCKGIVEDLLKFSRSTPIRKIPVDVNSSLAEVISLLGHQFELDKIDIKTDLDGTIPKITGDAEKLKQVFMNLLMNAKQAISGKGEISVTTRRNGNSIDISISDSGSGIAPQVMNKIFDPFFTTKPVGEGTGLGLSVSYGIIQDHSGRIEVESRPGKGSTFTVILPLNEQSAAEEAL
ncbi:two-component system sensor histidine kinase NtrB [Desulfomonile tiedjei]|uniref:histidine kinase n=1 Tax=Desulfomonile tiedjei (strain ATCC 49306 / DSM 6799 / DCB-1) TaxID=706587 RepID=I4C4G2_DESTA|nr:PAS domain-containing sensor histidine kinase [Desulfomonile tiedjei]AFM24453.1 PAS domain S-box [Desulfomonile tiedjei DSM 6799]